MITTWIAGVVALAAVVPPLADAQERREPVRREPVRLEAPRTFSFAFSRGRIGVVVQTNDDRDADKLGARIEAVSPSSPAEKAGLKAGDVITRFNGVALARSSDEESNPGTKLVRLAQALDPGDTVRVEYRRDNEHRTATLVAEEVDIHWSLREPLERAREDLRLRLEDGFPPFDLMPGRSWARLELVSLNPDLGAYFGTTEGVLVVKAAEEESLPLKGGDVILSIDGRKPSSPAHAMRILRSFNEGETAKIEVMRKQKRTTVSWTVPEREERRERSIRRRSSDERT